MPKDAPPRWDHRMRQRLSRGEAAALGELYDRYASLVHMLAHRVLEDEAQAGRVTREVFAHVWEHPDEFSPTGHGTLRSWLAEITQERAVERLRRTADPEAGEEELAKLVARAGTAARADYIVNVMPAPLRAALHLAYFQRRDYRQTAADLGVTEDEARRRLRLGLQLLASAHASPRDGSPR
ncbi:sigma-70 family RNA polymerase sigma factor [Streptomyces sp. BI20]|uniref:sigma-70 family RNA polymerase sigma factor n=1 Tax=Streptomyces sp. BI20 TaxID=3403460 RepID=UPI003C756D53